MPKILDIFSMLYPPKSENARKSARRKKEISGFLDGFRDLVVEFMEDFQNFDNITLIPIGEEAEPYAYPAGTFLYTLAKEPKTLRSIINENELYIDSNMKTNIGEFGYAIFLDTMQSKENYDAVERFFKKYHDEFKIYRGIYVSVMPSVVGSRINGILSANTEEKRLV